jgi:hypothetical protein
VVYGDDGISSADVKVNITAQPIPSGGFAATAVITLPDDDSAGTISVMFINSPGGDNAYLSITVARDADAMTVPENVVLRVYNPSYDIYYDATGMTVPYDEFDELSGDIPPTLNASTGMDTLFYSFDDKNPANISDDLSEVDTSYYTGLGNYVTSMTISGDMYAASGNSGWMYGAYRQEGSTTTYNLVEVTPYIGTDVYFVETRDVLIWKYGDLGTYSSLFPAQITYP